MKSLREELPVLPFIHIIPEWNGQRRYQSVLGYSRRSCHCHHAGRAEMDEDGWHMLTQGIHSRLEHNQLNEIQAGPNTGWFEFSVHGRTIPSRQCDTGVHRRMMRQKKNETMTTLAAAWLHTSPVQPPQKWVRMWCRDTWANHGLEMRMEVLSLELGSSDGATSGGFSKDL